MNSDAGRGGNGGKGNGNNVGTGGGKYSDDGTGGSSSGRDLWSGDDGSAGVAKHLARRSSIEGGDSKMSGDDGGVGKARSLSTSASDGKCIGAWGQINILAPRGGGSGGAAADSSFSNGPVYSKEGTGSTAGAMTQPAGARCSSSSSEGSSLFGHHQRQSSS
ncbi:hypothetical protein Tco_1243586 [Tanacetum coccineum]